MEFAFIDSSFIFIFVKTINSKKGEGAGGGAYYY
jgi:hypothetical protein